MKTKIIKKPLTGPLEEMPVYRHGLRPEEKNRADKQLMVAVRKKRSQMSEAQMQYASLMQLRYLIEDYIKADQYDERWSFANVLRAYIKLKYKSNKAFAQDLCLDETELSSVLNKRRSPSDKTIIRLELHSLIVSFRPPAGIVWFSWKKPISFSIILKTSRQKKKM